MVPMVPLLIGNYVNLYVKDALSRVKGVGDIFARSDEFSMPDLAQPGKAGAGYDAGRR